jgi:hypothetical protein
MSYPVCYVTADQKSRRKFGVGLQSEIILSGRGFCISVTSIFGLRRKTVNSK